ncbi:MAG: hypothetical protein V1793_07420 [Pseudomonadota bacterium]
MRTTWFGWFIPLFATACIMLASSPAQSSNTPNTLNVVALGSRLIINENITGAKSSAISDALTASVERTLIQMLTKTDISSHLEFIFDSILSNAQKYVITYKVLSENQQDRRYIVAVETTINAQALEALLKDNDIINKKNKVPEALVFISEQIPGEILPRYWWGKNPLPYRSTAEESLAEIFAQQGTVAVAHNMDRPIPENLGVTFEFIHDADAAIRLGVELKSDIVIMGKASATEVPGQEGSAPSYKAMVDLDAYSTDSGERIASLSKDATSSSAIPAEGIQAALARAGVLAAEEMSARIGAFWSEYSLEAQTIETRIEGTDYLTSLIMLRRVLGTMKGIDDIQTKELASDHAVVDILFQGSPKKLADVLLLESFDSFDIELSDIKESSLTIKFVTKKDMQAIKPSEIKGAYISK